ncbi:pyridoxamine 5'-phosphate oxidase family protein [Aneurinibacillus aneurinilyticus ATCC 12856]|uniref:Pyridoxamine 5'-phosphate oxidase family protein n=2 Tax=Aneurinibacillus aneurinilyticus TaxID=1391 RepID=U1X106_ANEAE|nr:pyridoxamine 5'-phosphate oxidase family protein [Aneurinibacillus aneurinilyticus ATCC 12856]
MIVAIYVFQAGNIVFEGEDSPTEMQCEIKGVDTMAKKTEIPTTLTGEQQELLNAETLVLLSTVDAETKIPTVNAISWVKAPSESKIRFSVSASSRIVANVKDNPGVTLCVIGLETVYSIVGKGTILTEKLEGVAMPLANIEVDISAIHESMFWGAKIVQEPTFEKTYDLEKAKALDEQVYAAMLK